MSEKAVRLFRASIPVFQALSDPARQDIILLLAEKEPLTVNEIAAESTLSRPAVSHHLKILRDQKLVQIEQKGTQRHYSLALEDAVGLLKALLATVEEECFTQEVREDSYES
ncbi:ArsR/SmtB family transcription factor [Metabacillus iocasae]|uniref:DNA-binding transcriptional ArsR family regulator n=1 Tax=Priestia iocasae TaxID=2291674 RepID=A0ABS2QSA9_9BACI|nr:metalloregulator ArsR/SmtB family transcription factor [Metabacillus iocasae]MBM7702188.1 DNA-binding transcriptional ArsR family regulator [Metabacillus iocasae]